MVTFSVLSGSSSLQPELGEPQVNKFSPDFLKDNSPLLPSPKYLIIISLDIYFLSIVQHLNLDNTRHYVEKISLGIFLGLAFMRKHKNPSSCWTEPVPDGSKINLPVANSEPTSNRVTYSRRLKKIVQHLWEGGLRKCVRIPSCRYQRQRTRSAQVPEQIALQHVFQIMVRQLCPRSLWRTPHLSKWISPE